MEKIISFDSLGVCEYEKQYRCPDIECACNEIVENIVNQNNRSIDDMITEIADSSVDVYTQDLVENCCSVDFVKYIDESISEFGSCNNAISLFKQAQFYYYYEQLRNNIEAIVKNALLIYIGNSTIKIRGQENDVVETVDSLKLSVKNYISNYVVDTSLSGSDVIRDFDGVITTQINELLENKNNTKLKNSDSNEDSYVGARYIEDESMAFNVDEQQEAEPLEVVKVFGDYCVL